MLEIQAPVNEAYPFKTVNRGDIFEFNKQYYMKIETAYGPENCSPECVVNAVNFKNGTLAHFGSDSKVYLLDGKMTLVRRDMSF